MTFPIIDAHQHFWDPTRNYHPWLCDEPPIPFRYGDYRALRQPYMPPDLLADAAPHAVVGTVYVEAEWDPRDPGGELDWIESVHARFGHPGAVVGQAWMDRDDVDSVLGRVAESPLGRSVRHKPASAATPDAAGRDGAGSMDDRRWRDGYARLAAHGLHFDLQTPWWHLDAALALARDFPQTTLILNHTGLPSDRSEAGLAGWHAAMAALAEAENVAVKISGLGQPGAAWTIAANGWIVQETIAMFGVARCLFASNYPVDRLCADYRTIFDGFRALVADRPPAEQRALFHDNAERIYRPI